MSNRMDEEFRESLKIGCWGIIIELTVIALTCIVMSIFTGCTTHKQVTKERTEDAYMHESMNLNVHEVTHETDLSTKTIVIYDTSLPINPETKRPPVKAEIKVEANVTKETSGDTAETVVREEETHETQEEKEERETEALDKWRIWAVFGILALCLGFGLWAKNLPQELWKKVINR